MSQFNRTLQAAIEYKDLGFSVLRVQGKRPIDSGWSRSRPARTHELIKAFYHAETNGLNIGLRTGSGLVAIDIDRDKGGFDSWREFVGDREQPPTAEAVTGGMGRHVLYRGVPDWVGCSQGFRGMAGVDTRCKGGLIVVEPSIHPTTKQPYLWRQHPAAGVAPCPDWLLDVLTKEPPRRAGQERLRSGKVEEMPRPLGPIVAGPVAALLEESIRRFEIPRHKTRGNYFKRIVPSLLGRGYDDDTIEEVVTRWWAYYHEEGRCKTSPSQSGAEVRRYLTDLKASSRFGQATSGIDHRQERRSIQLSDRTIQRMGEKVQPTDHKDKPPANTGTANKPILRSSHLIKARFSPDLMVCQTAKEFAFVEALLVMCLYQIGRGSVASIRFTKEQICEVILDRNPGMKVGGQEWERLSNTYFDRPDKPARRLSLLRRIAVGQKAADAREACPSEYEPTGILALLAD